MDKVNKKVARRLFNNGKNITLYACKVVIGNPWIKGLEINKKNYDDFDKIINEFEFYNCSNELGYYASYYITD